MVRLVNNFYYLDIFEQNGNILSKAKSGIKELQLANEAVFLSMIDDLPYFINYRFTENPATPGLPYISAQQLYADMLVYLVT